MFNKMTYQISLVVLVIAAFYTLLYSGITGLLMSSAVALIAAAFVEPLELVVAITVIFALLFVPMHKKFKHFLEGFKNPEIVTDIAKMEKMYRPAQQELKNPRREPAGVYDPMVEGFEDVQPTKPKDGEPSKSAAAPSASTTNQVSPSLVKEVATAPKKSEKYKDMAEEDFRSATGNLFKLGQMPSENAEGPKLDAGQTIMKAMSSFDPKTISAMTDDTKKLLETQKGLMTMLNQMRPVLAEGKDLLNTFSGMFGGNGGLKM